MRAPPQCWDVHSKAPLAAANRSRPGTLCACRDAPITQFWAISITRPCAEVTGPGVGSTTLCRTRTRAIASAISAAEVRGFVLIRCISTNPRIRGEEQSHVSAQGATSTTSWTGGPSCCVPRSGGSYPPKWVFMDMHESPLVATPGQGWSEGVFRAYRGILEGV